MAPSSRKAAPALFTMPSGLAFADVMARALSEDASLGGRFDGAALADITILLPTRRAVRTLSEAFLRQSGGRAMILPSIRPMGDVDEEEMLLDPGFSFREEGAAFGAELPPAMESLSRQIVLTKLINAWGEVNPDAGAMSAGQAAALAGDLGRFLDAVETEGVELSALQDLVPGDYAQNWQITLEFLQIITRYWPDILADKGLIDPARRRTLLLEAQAAAWAAKPPQGPVIAAGSTGSVPASAKLLSVIAGLPQGAVVLPGLDLDLAPEAWEAVGESHPQFGMKQLLERLGAGRDDVALWPGAQTAAAEKNAARARLLNEALRPAEATDGWRAVLAAEGKDIAGALEGLHLIEAANAREEALAIALILRSVLEEKEKTAALVTPDRSLARRVAAELARWGIEVDDSSGVPLAETPVFIFLRLLLEAVEEDFAPVPLLSLLKHPLAAAGMAPGDFRADVRRLERALLRGPRPAPGLEGLELALNAYEEERKRDEPRLRALIAQLKEAAAPLLQLPLFEKQEAGALLGAFLEAAEALAARDEVEGAARLWAGDDGEAAAAFFAALMEAANEAPALAPAGLRAFMESLALGRVVRPRFGRHPRLMILGPLEARLQQADCLILGGLNEGMWPAETKVDPWLSRPMRRNLGLYSPERRIGLSAHDFVQAAACPRVFLTRALKVEGAPAVPSRWLLRLESFLKGAGIDGLPLAQKWTHWAREIDVPSARPAALPPRPAPPLHARPDRLSVTDVETLIRDPYAFYARRVLGLKALDAIDDFAPARDRGILIHRALDTFVKRYPETLPENIEEVLLEIGEEVFADAPDRPEVIAFWQPRYEQIARFLASAEPELRQDVLKAYGEIEGMLEIGGLKRPVSLHARADRIDVKRSGALHIMDYKTGGVPSAAQVESGLSPQLSLEAAMAEAGGFENVPKGPVETLTYLHLAGGEQGGAVKKITEEGSRLAAEALGGLKGLLASYENESLPYLSRPRVQFIGRYSDYDHLARVKEWSASDGEEGA